MALGRCLKKECQSDWGLAAKGDQPQEEKRLLPVQHRSPQTGSCCPQTGSCYNQMPKSFQVSVRRPFALRFPLRPHTRWRKSQAGLIARLGQLPSKLYLPPDWCLPALVLRASQSHFWGPAAVWKTRSDFLVFFPGWRVRFPSRPWEVLQILLIWKPLCWVAGLVWPMPLVLAFLSPKKNIRKLKPKQPQMG